MMPKIMASALAPVVLFVFNRPDHTQHTLLTLSRNTLADKTDVIVYSDGPRSDTDKPLIQKTLAHVSAFRPCFGSLTVVESTQNHGLQRAILTGITEVLHRYEKVIVLEDDLATSPAFLTYMNEGLSLYANDAQVGSIHAYMYPTPTPLPDTFFIRGGDCWGWGTWQRAWNAFDQNGSRLLNQLKTRSLTHAFDLDGAYPFTRMLQNQVAGRIQSWAVRWHAHLFLNNMLTLYPCQTLVHNRGCDGSGTHADQGTYFNAPLASTCPNLRRIPLEESQEGRRAIASFWTRHRPPSWMTRMRLALFGEPHQ